MKLILEFILLLRLISGVVSLYIVHNSLYYIYSEKGDVCIEKTHRNSYGRR